MQPIEPDSTNERAVEWGLTPADGRDVLEEEELPGAWIIIDEPVEVKR